MDYKEKLEEAKRLYETANADQKYVLESLFPELKESEDEKVRKEIVEYLKKNLRLEWATWLEKQGEPQDKGEISDGYHTFNELYNYRMLYNASFFNLLPKEWVHKSKKHHNGEECFGGGWFIVMANLPTGQISNHYELKDWDLFHIQEKEVADEWDGHTPQEAAERLHKYLLEKQGKVESDNDDIEVEEKGIREAFNKIEDEKQCKQKPQRMISAEAKEAMYDKPADKVEPKFKVKYAGSEYNVLEIKEIAGDAYYGIEDEPNHIDYVLPDNCEIVSERKSSWSEEDDDDAWMNDIISKVENNLQLNKAEIDWLKSLRPQLKQKWSEEDDAMLDTIEGWLDTLCEYLKDSRCEHIPNVKYCIDRLKSLKTRYTWKPSDEQMKALHDLNLTGNISYAGQGQTLIELYNDLKKLKGE